MPYRVMLGVPSGGQLCEESARASWLPSLHHSVDRHPCTRGVLNFNMLWCEALNRGAEKTHTHFAMMHTDIEVVEDDPERRWLDKLIEEMDRLDLDFVSTPVAIKDHRGVTSSGIGDPDNRWSPYRRFTVPELSHLPTTFTAEDAGYRHPHFLLHNEALCCFDLRKPVWYGSTAAEGSAHVMFHLNEDIRLVGGKWTYFQETEDWSFSRNLWQVGAKTAISRRAKVIHFGRIGYENYGAGGVYQAGDEDTRAKWASDPGALTCA